MEFEWDEKKRHSNIEKHGVDFDRAKDIWKGPTIQYAAYQRKGEWRYKTVGETGGRIITIIWTPRNERRRIISARTAHRSERKDYKGQTG